MIYLLSFPLYRRTKSVRCHRFMFVAIINDNTNNNKIKYIHTFNLERFTFERYKNQVKLICVIFIKL